MRKAIWLILCLTLSLGLLQLSYAQEKDDEGLKLKVGGVYTAWFQKQQDFFFGRTEYNDNYVVQMLRLNLSLAVSDHLKAVTRFDMAQGWWGVDNDDFRGDFDGDDNADLSSRFSNKDTNYGFHVDIGYLDFMVPDAAIPINIRVGRMYYGLGNKIILDSNFDGVQVDFKPAWGNLGIGWARVSEGQGGFSELSDNDNSATLGVDNDDADLFFAKFNRKSGNLTYELYGMYYMDNGDDDGTAFMPNGIDYARSRFAPNVSKLGAIGLTLDYANRSWNLKGEFDYLTGKDDIANPNSGPNQLLDVNDGDISGYNLYVKANKDVNPKVNLGVTFGMGSGDDDLAGGSGNVNKLKTMGFFYITELWEDSIMPDEEGITPQGLGAPNTRGYRELENTTILQGNIMLKPMPRLKLAGSYSLIRATEDISGWADANGDGVISTTEFTGESSKSIGSEIDFKFDYNIYNQLVWTLRGGYLIAGDGALLLINGNTQNDTNPWELKMTITYKF